MKKQIAIIHDWLEKKAGAEKVLEQIIKIYPDADLFVLVDFMSKKDKFFLKKTKIIKSFIQYLPFSKIHFRKYIFFFPLAVKLFNLKKYDLIISSSHSFAKNVNKTNNQIHICYCHTPIRYCHVMMDEYLKEYKIKNKILRTILKTFLLYLGKWDIKNNKNVDFFIANSNYIKKRIKKYYNKKSTVIHPPIDTKNFTLKYNKKNFFLTASRLVPYKKIDLVINAFNEIKNKSLYVIGSGPQLNYYKILAKKNVKIVGWANNKKLVQLMRNAKGFIFPALEDFGIIPLEAQSCGTPVLAYGKGGSLDTVLNFPKKNPTGIFFKKQNTKEIIRTIELFEKKIKFFKPENARKNAFKFKSENFRKKFKKYVDECINLKKRNLYE